MNRLDWSTRSVYALQITVPSLLVQLLLILLGLVPLLIWTRPGSLLLLLDAAFNHLQSRLDIGTRHRGLRSAAGRDGVGLIRIPQWLI